jgi:hypothetical protein
LKPIVNPLLAPLMIASASTIALRTMLMVPERGRLSTWQRREAGQMIMEKAAAMQESQLEAIAFAWSALWMPWTLWGSGAAGTKAFERAAGRMIEPYSTRASRNARRLSVRAMKPVFDAVPIVAATPRPRRRRAA